MNGNEFLSGERLSETDEVFEEENSSLRPGQGDPVRLSEGAELRPGGWEGGQVPSWQNVKLCLYGSQPVLYVGLSPVDGIWKWEIQ